MRVIEYYDRIHKQKIELEVTDEVALFLQSSYKQFERHQNLYNHYTTSLDSVIYNSEGENITLKEAIPEPEDEIMDCRTCKQRLKFYNLVWKIVAKLGEDKYDLIWDLFVLKKSQREIASEKHTSESSIAQLKDTALKQLAYYFYSDEEFKQTELYQRNKREFDLSLNDVVKEIDNPNGLNIDLEKIYDLTKENTQTLKMLNTLGIQLDEKQIELFSFMNRTVKHFLENVGVGKNEQKHTLVIPRDLEIPDKLLPKKKR